MEWICPYCKQIIATSEKDAMNFLKTGLTK
jgi:hypothetical protein